MIRWALPLTSSCEVSIPLALRVSTSASSTRRVDDHAVADDRGDVVVEDAARHQLEGEGLAVDHDGVPGVVAALVADDHLHLLGQEVGELALALITPLGPDDHGCGHACSSVAESGLRTSVARGPNPSAGCGPVGPRARWRDSGRQTRAIWPSFSSTVTVEPSG